MIEVFDYYSQGLDKHKEVSELHKNAKKEYLRWLKKEQGAKSGTPAAIDAAKKKELWARANVLFSTEAGRKKYDEELAAWQNSIEAKRAKGQVDQSAKEFASATETVLELVARAWEELDKGNLHAASQVAAKAMRVDPSNWEPYLIAGYSSFRQDNFDESMSCMRQAARLNPDNAQIFSGLGELYERQDNWQEAFNNYSKAIALAPDEIDYKIRAGFVCVRAEVPDQGIDLLRKALELDPDHQGAKWALGVALADSARFGWTDVAEGHPRVAPGLWAMSREQALQAVSKLHEANALGIEDAELSAHLASVKKSVDSSVERHFDGSWALFGVILLIAFFMKENIGAALVIAAIAAAYYGAHLPPRYATNARILAGDSKLKTGFFDWLDNIQNQWVKLTINLILIALLPVFTLYFAIKNWTGENAPLGNALKDIRGLNPQQAQVTVSAAGGIVPPTDSNQAHREPSNTATQIPINAKLAVAGIDQTSKYLIGGTGGWLKPVLIASVALSVVGTGYFYYLSGRKDKADSEGGTTAVNAQAPNQSQIQRQALNELEALVKQHGFNFPKYSAGRAIMFRYLESGGDPNLRSGAGSLLNIAAQNEYLDVMKLLIARGGDVNGFGDGTPLYWAIEGAELNAALFLIRNGADVNRAKSGGYTPLDAADAAVGYGKVSADDLKLKNVINELLARGGKGARYAGSTGSAQPPTVVDVNTSITRPAVRVGDSYTYETLDQVEPKLNNITSREIIEVNSTEFVMRFVNVKSKYTRQLTYDNDLNLTSSRSGDNDGFDYNPALRYFNFPMKSGDSWNSSSTERNIKTGKTRSHTLRALVSGVEQVTVPAGTFSAIKITIDSELNDDSQITYGRDISWYAPDIRRTVKSELESRDPNGKTGRRTVHLLSYRLQ